MMERGQRLSDSNCLASSKHPKMKISTISSPTLLHKPSLFNVENEKKISSRDNPTYRKNTFSLFKRVRKEGCTEDFKKQWLSQKENELDTKQEGNIMNESSSIVLPIDARKVTPNEEIGVHTELLYSGTKDTPSIRRTNVN